MSNCNRYMDFVYGEARHGMAFAGLLKRYF